MISQVQIPYLEEEPSSVSCIEASVIASVVEVRDKPAMSEDSSELDNGVLGFFEEPSGQEETLQRYEGISSPASGKTCRKMRETCGHCVLMIFEFGRRYSTPHLNDSKCQALNEHIF